MSVDAPTSRGGTAMVIVGAISLALSILVTAVAIAYFVAGMQESSEAMSMLFIFLLGLWMVPALPTWYLGVAMLGGGRRKQRGPVRGEPWAWVLALAVFPVIIVPFGLLVAGVGDSGLLVAAFASIPVGIVGGLVGVAWLTWGPPRADRAVV